MPMNWNIHAIHLAAASSGLPLLCFSVSSAKTACVHTSKAAVFKPLHLCCLGLVAPYPSYKWPALLYNQIASSAYHSWHWHNGTVPVTMPVTVTLHCQQHCIAEQIASISAWWACLALLEKGNARGFFFGSTQYKADIARQQPCIVDEVSRALGFRHDWHIDIDHTLTRNSLLAAGEYKVVLINQGFWMTSC